MRAFLLISLIIFSFSVFAQNQEEPVKAYKNTFKYNISTPALLSLDNVIIGYERVVNPYQTFSIAVGMNSLPNFRFRSNPDSDILISILTNTNNMGFHFSGDYRFYLKSENKFDAPRGVYIGPYYSYNSYNRINEWGFISDNFDGTLTTDLFFGIHTIGGELGYQFQLGKRIMLDFTFFGPGIAYYKTSINSFSDLSPEDEILFYDRINQILSENIPGFSQVVDGSGIELKGSRTNRSYGYRFLINIGFRF
ncbi:MAG: hypothetical protein ACXIUQ_10160 [Cecembia sp.]